MKRLVPLVLTLVLASGCGGGEKAAAPVVEPDPVVTTTPEPCPVVTTPRFPWPKEVPAELPQPPSATFDKVTRTPEGLTVVRFSTKTSLTESVLFVVRNIEKAGFTLGRGDAEPVEADAPFGKGNLRGVYKMLLREKCVTDWFVAVTRSQPTSNSPLLPTPTATPGSQPLPFG